MIAVVIIVNLVDLVQSYIYRNAVAVQEEGDVVRFENLSIETGGVVAGSIGMGKTTFRFHLIKYLQSIRKLIIDFDYKGETSSKLSEPEHVLIPGKNLMINLFDMNLGDPKKFSTRIANTIRANSTDLTPAQSHLLQQALYQTYNQGGTLDDFLSNIFCQGLQYSEDDILASKYTPLALYHRISWLFIDLGEVFCTTSTSHNLFQSEYDLFFDLSYLKQRVSPRNIARFIELVLQMLLTSSIKLQKTAILIEESQLLYDAAYKGAITEIITTLRHKEVSLYLIGTRFDEFPKMLLDSGSFIQFYSESRAIQHLISSESQRELHPYQFYIINSSKATVVHNLLPFNSTIRSHALHKQQYTRIVLPTISPDSLRYMILNGLIFQVQYEPQELVYQLHDVSSFKKIENQLNQLLKLYPEILPVDLIMTIWSNSQSKLIDTYGELSLYEFIHKMEQFLEYLDGYISESNRQYLLDQFS